MRLVFLASNAGAGVAYANADVSYKVACADLLWHFVWCEVQRLWDSFGVNLFCMMFQLSSAEAMFASSLRQSHNLGHIMIAYIYTAVDVPRMDMLLWMMMPMRCRC